MLRVNRLIDLNRCQSWLPLILILVLVLKIFYFQLNLCPDRRLLWFYHRKNDKNHIWV